jgi:hypothetical protein
MGGTSKQLLALALAALLALGIAACGGSGGSSSSTATAAPETTGATTEDHGSDKSGDDQGGSGDDSDGSSSSSSKGSAGFRTPGGDNSIQNFGDEADAAEVEAATAALSGYLAARARGDWARSCADLAKAAVAPLEQLASSSPQLKGKDCGAILAALEGGVPASSRASTLTGPIASLRAEGERGFALYHGPHGVNYFVPMVKEGDSWKVGSLAPSEFP